MSILLAAAAMAAAAEAGERKKFRRQAAPADHYYAGPGFVRRVPGLRLLFGDYALSEEEFNALYGAEDKAKEYKFDETYYEPQPLVTAKPKPASKSIAKPVKPGNAALTTATLGETLDVPAAKKTPPAAKPAAVAKPQAATVAKPAPPAPPKNTLSCDKAGSIIAGYGFAGVKPDSCKGKVYAFNATRDGRTFAIKVDAASGELTEVKKLN